MKRIYILTISTLLCLLSHAQYSTTILINRTKFHVDLNPTDMTAEINDLAYRIDDSEYPLYGHSRKIKGLNSNQKVLEIPSTVQYGGETYTITSIGQNAFADYTNIEYVNIPPTVTNIGEYAFLRTPLLKVMIPASVRHIGNRAFGWCRKLKEVTLPEGNILQEGGDVFSESKAHFRYIRPEYAETPASERPQMATQTPPRTTAITSDVDMDIPTVSQKNENTFAIIIANEKYQEVADVEFALRDGNTFKTYCHDVLGLPEKNVHFRHNATLNHIQTELDWLKKIAAVCEGDARIIFYYAGHGIPDERTGSSYLLPVDGKGDNYATGYSLNKLYKELGGLPANSVTVFLDACFSGAQRDGGMLSAARGVAIRAKGETAMGNMVVFAAAQEDETASAYQEKGHGLFTYFLLKKLKETRGNVTLAELGNYLRKNVNKESVLTSGKTQTPSISASPSLGENWRNLRLR